MYKRIISVLTFYNGCLHRTKQFVPDYHYTSKFVDLWSIDELVILNIGPNNDNHFDVFTNAVRNVVENCFVPVSIGGGVRTEADAARYFELGADKIILNSTLVENPGLVSSLANVYGSQAIVASIDFKKDKDKNYYCFVNCGRKKISCSPQALAREAENIGAGELMLNSIERDGSLLGYDLLIMKKIISSVSVPVIVAGGAGNWKHFEEALNECGASGVCTNNIYHFTDSSIESAKLYLAKKNFMVRM